MTIVDFDQAFQAIVERLEPGAKLLHHQPLTGGVSAQIYALRYSSNQGETKEVVLRQHSASEWKPQATDITKTEFALQSLLFQSGIAIPEPLLLDVSCKLLASPFLIMAMVPGTTVVTENQLDGALIQMADFLIELHSLDAESFSQIDLPEREDPVSETLKYLPDDQDMTLLKSTISGWTVSPARNSLLHGDFWPGNILWQAGKIAAVIDWEDAAIGCPLSDLACTRVEIMVMYGEQAMNTFTDRYLDAMNINAADLLLWEIYVSSSALAAMGDWGLPKDIELARRAQTTLFRERAVQEFLSIAQVS